MLCATEAPGTFSAETNSASYSLPAADSPLGVLGPQWIRRDGCVSAADLSQRGGRVSPFLRRGDAQAPKYFCWLPAGSKNFRRGGCPGFKIFPMGLSGIRENLEERRIFPRSSGCEGSIFAAELPAPSKLQQWGCARFAISAARSAGASKDPQGAGQASKYVHCGSKGFKESQRGAARRGSVGFSKGFGAYSKMFAAELAAPSKLQQWAGASCKISAARSSGASKNPQGASQASKYFAVQL